MALTYPYSIDLFADKLKLNSVTFSPAYGQEYSGQVSGMIRAKDLRPQLWKAVCETAPMLLDEANDVQALFEGLNGSIGTFNLYNPLRPYPKEGVINSTSVVINTLSTDGVSLSLSGLPSNAIVSRGDMLCFTYGANSSVAFHRVLETVTASTAGVTTAFSLSGGIRTGASTGASVTLNKPYGVFRMVTPFTQNPDTVLTAKFSFTAIQVI